MNIMVKIKNVYGRELVYPVCPKAKALALLAGHETLTPDDIKVIKLLGYVLEVETPSLAAIG